MLQSSNIQQKSHAITFNWSENVAPKASSVLKTTGRGYKTTGIAQPSRSISPLTFNGAKQQHFPASKKGTRRLAPSSSSTSSSDRHPLPPKSIRNPLTSLISVHFLAAALMMLASPLVLAAKLHEVEVDWSLEGGT